MIERNNKNMALIAFVGKSNDIVHQNNDYCMHVNVDSIMERGVIEFPIIENEFSINFTRYINKFHDSDLAKFLYLVDGIYLPDEKIYNFDFEIRNTIHLLKDKYRDYNIFPCLVVMNNNNKEKEEVTE